MRSTRSSWSGRAVPTEQCCASVTHADDSCERGSVGGSTSRVPVYSLCPSSETAFFLSSPSSTSRDRSSCVATRPRGHQTHRATRHGPRATRPVIFTQVRASWLKRTLPRILHPSCTHLAPILHPRGPRPPRCLSAAVCGATARSLMGMGQAEPLTRLQSIRTPPHTLLHLAPCRPTHYPYKWCSQLVLARWL